MLVEKINTIKIFMFFSIPFSIMRHIQTAIFIFRMTYEIMFRKVAIKALKMSHFSLVLKDKSLSTKLHLDQIILEK